MPNICILIDELEVLKEEFYSRDTAKVAQNLLGKKLIRKTECNKKFMSGIIVETEAYYGETDPASRAYNGKKNYNKVMWCTPGKLFIYNVHKYWLLNIVAHEVGEVGGILIRALEPLEGVELMKRNRPVDKIRELTNGPGKLALALGIDKSFNGLKTTDFSSKINIIENDFELKMGSSNRIGVTRDLQEKLRFYVLGNRFVSRRH